MCNQTDTYVLRATPTTHHPSPTTHHPPSMSCSTLTPAKKRPTANATKTKKPSDGPRPTTPNTLTFRTKMVGVEGGVKRGVSWVFTSACVCECEWECEKLKLLGIQAHHSICHVFVFILASVHYTGQQICF